MTSAFNRLNFEMSSHRSSGESVSDKSPQAWKSEVVERWIGLEDRFAANLYAGEASAGSIVIVQPTTFPELVITAVHAVNHTRNGRIKFADRGTGGLVLLLAGMLGCSAVVVASADSGDANYDVKHPAKYAVRNLTVSPRFLVDIHGMQDRGVDLELGTGMSDRVPGAIREAFTKGLKSLKTAVDEQFNAGYSGTMTRWAQSEGLLACQLEISSRMRPPTATIEAMATIGSHLESLLHPLHLRERNDF